MTLIAHAQYVGPSLEVIIVLTWLFHLIPLLIVAVPVWLCGRKRTKWNGLDFTVLIFPFVAWCCAATLLQNPAIDRFVIEGTSIGGIAALAPILRVAIGGKFNELALGTLGVVCLLAFLLGTVPEEVLPF
jgi:hypothetical protein